MAEVTKVWRFWAVATMSVNLWAVPECGPLAPQRPHKPLGVWAGPARREVPGFTVSEGNPATCPAPKHDVPGTWRLEARPSHRRVTGDSARPPG